MEDIQPKSLLEKTTDSMSIVINKSKETVSGIIDKGHETFTTDTGKPNVLLIFSVLLIMFVIYLIMYYYRQSKFAPYLEIGPIPITQKGNLNIQGDSIPDSTFSEEYSYSMWLYISDDTFMSQSESSSNDKYIILSRSDATPPSKMVYAIENISEKRTLLIRYASEDATETTDLLQDGDGVIKCDIENIPYNTFFHLAVVVYGNTIVVYINGVLIKTITHWRKLITLNTSDKIVNDYSGYGVHEGDGWGINKFDYPTFKGHISKLKYFVDISKQDGGALSDKQVYELYLNGPYPSLFERMVNSISRKFISFVDDAHEEAGALSVGGSEWGRALAAYEAAQKTVGAAIKQARAQHDDSKDKLDEALATAGAVAGAGVAASKAPAASAASTASDESTSPSPDESAVPDGS